MSGNILTPLSIWGDFAIDSVPEAELIEEKNSGDIIVSKVYIDGRKTDFGQVKIYGVIARQAEKGIMPAVLIVSDFNRPFDEKTAIDLAKRGYLALIIDLCGKTENAKYYTEYPEDIAYADYSVAKDGLDRIDGDATETCWYEWGAAGRYAAEYLKNQPCVNSVVGLGIADGAGVMWHIVANNETFSAAAFVMDAGWKAYKKIFKFGGDAEPQFSDDTLKYVAGIEPQSYAKHVKCPCLMLSPTNSVEYDCDRAYDTVTRINENAYRAVNYSIGGIDRVDCKAIEQISMFFGAFTDRDGVERTRLPKEPEIKCDVSDGCITTEVTVDPENIKDVSVYASEEITDPSERTWVRLTEGKKVSADKYVFGFIPYNKSLIATFFVKAVYKNGFALCSNIIAKRFNEKEIKFGHKEKIIYSGRDIGSESVFSAISDDDGVYLWHETDKNSVSVKKGPMAIEGVTAKGGLRTFKMNAAKYKPDDYAILMFDIYVKADCEFTVKLVADYYGTKTEYVYAQKVNGGKIWHNLRIEMSKFKTAEGRILKSYANINVIEFKTDGDYLINNILWV